MRRQTKKVLIIAIASFTFVGILPSVLVPTINSKLIATSHLIGHRGWSAKYFQNTYAAFNGAVGGEHAKFWGAETDLQMDHDGVIWCSHYINPFEDGSKKINVLTSAQIKAEYLKTTGSIDTSTLPSKAFPTGALNPYHINVPHDADNDQLCLFWNSEANGKGYLNSFLNNQAHPIIELKIESVLGDTADSQHNCMTIDNTKVITFIDKILTDIEAANDASNHTLLSRCYFVSFFDDLLAATITEMKDSKFNGYFNDINHNQFQKLLDDGGVGRYILSTNTNFTNQTPGEKSGSNTHFKNYTKYIDGSWCASSELPKYPIGLDVYYAFVTSQMIAKAHENGVEVNCWTADYTRTEIAEALSLDILAKSGCDYITTDQWYDLK